MINLEKEGKLTLPRVKNTRGDRAVTDEIIRDVINAWTPGGEGEYHYNPRLYE